MKKIILRKDAKAKGLKVYFTGKACLRGHIAERRTSSCECVACERLRKQKQTPLPKKKAPEEKKVIVNVLKNRYTSPERIQSVKTVREVRFARPVHRSFYKAYIPVITSDRRVFATC